jgi:hypothetical protein
MSFTKTINDNWVTYKNEKANYSIDFPKEPTVKKKKRKKTTSYKVKSRDDDYRYSLNSTVSKNDFQDVENLTEKLYKIFTDATGGEIEEKGTFTIGEYEGISAKIKTDKGAGILYRVIIIKNVVYHFSIISGVEYAPQEIQDKFFGSFKFHQKEGKTNG